mgnify:CR=1 FL=1
MRLVDILNPLYIVVFLFGAQFLIWLLFMPDVPDIPLAAPRYSSADAIFKYVVLLLLFLAGICLGKMMAASFHKGEDHSSIGYNVPDSVLVSRARSLRRFAIMTLTATVLGEMIYVRDVLLNPSVIGEAFEQGTLSIVGEIVRSGRILGVTTLNNLFVIPAAIFSLLSFHPVTNRIMPRRARQARLSLVVIGITVLLHSLLFAARMFFVYYIVVVFAGYAVLHFRRRLRRWILLAIIAMILLSLLVVWSGELLRSGLRYARHIGAPLWSTEVQRFVLRLLIQGYVAADLNNALIIFDCEPGGNGISTTLLGRLLAPGISYANSPAWQSGYGTVNVLALWWFDVGWGACVLAPFMGWIIGWAYIIALRTLSDLHPLGLYYMLMFPGLFAITRINFYFLSIFVLPALFLTGYCFVWSLQRSFAKGGRYA